MLLAIIAGYLFVLSNGPKRISFKFFIDQLRAKNVAEVELFSRYAIGKFKRLPTPPVEAKAESKTDSKSDDSAAKTEPAATKPEQETAKQPPGPKEKAGKKIDREAALTFTVTLPERFNENPEFTKLLEDSGAKYDFSVQIDPTLWVFGIGMTVTVDAVSLFLDVAAAAAEPDDGGRVPLRLRQEPGPPLRRLAASGHVQGRGRHRGGQGRPDGDRRVPEEPEEVSEARRPRAQGRAAQRSAGHRQDAAGPGRRRRGGRAVLFDQRLGVHSDVRRRRRQPRPRHVPARPRKTPRRSSSSTRSTPSAVSAARASAAATTSASRRSIRSSARWTASRRPIPSSSWPPPTGPTCSIRLCCVPAASIGISPSTGRRKKGRVEIFKVHTRNVPLADDVDLETLAAGTIGLTGADIRNIVNEAALWAARNNKSVVEMADFEHARDKILMGPKREEVLTGKEKEKTAYHEAGHTILAWQLPGADRVHKVTIVPRGRSLGSTQTLPSEDRMSISEPELRDQLAVLLGGRAAEKLIYDETTVGAENDLERATGMARRMVMNWGMSDRLGPGQLQALRRRPVPRPRNPSAAAIQRAHDGADRRRGRPHPPRAIRPGHRPARQPAAQARRARRAAAAKRKSSTSTRSRRSSANRSTPSKTASRSKSLPPASIPSPPPRQLSSRHTPWAARKVAATLRVPSALQVSTTTARRPQLDAVERQPIARSHGQVRFDLNIRIPIAQRGRRFLNVTGLLAKALLGRSLEQMPIPRAAVVRD